MEIRSTPLSGLMLLENFVNNDKRGVFVKTFHADFFQQNGLATDFKESYYSLSYKDVIRGMHFQKQPYDHNKLIYVTQGSILDVIVDLRQKSPSYLQHHSIKLDEHTNAVYIPRGCAHGFLTLSETATVVYNVTSVYEPASDAGIHWNSFGFSWPVQNPIVSDRDASFEDWVNYQTIF